MLLPPRLNGSSKNTAGNSVFVIIKFVNKMLLCIALFILVALDIHYEISLVLHVAKTGF